IYLARTYAYVAAGRHGLVILDIENPERFRIDQVYNAKGAICDLHDVKLGITYVSEFAYLADGTNGLRVVQLTSPDTPGNHGYSPGPAVRYLLARTHMCGRFVYFTSWGELRRTLALQSVVELPPNYNVAPTQPVMVAREQDGQHVAVAMRWGLIPSWSKDRKT